MTIQRSIRLVLASAIAVALFGAAATAVAQEPPPPAQPIPPPPPMAPMPPPPPAPPAAPTPPQAPDATATGRFYQGTETTATYALPDSNGGTLTVHAGMPAQIQDYGPPPAFKALDTNHDGRISEEEAAAYPPLDSDFLFASQQGKYITAAQYKQWAATEH